MALFAKDSGKVKRSVDLSPNTDTALDAFRGLTEKRGVALSRGAAIDAVMGAVLRLSGAQAARLYEEAIRGLKSSQDMLDATSREDALIRQEAASEVEAWKRAAELFEILADGFNEPAPMRSVKMRGCRVLLPDSPDWIIVNEGDAAKSSNATVIEIRNRTRFNAPHFVYFDDGEASTSIIDKAILAVYPRYADILAARVEPIRDAKGNYLNLEQLAEAPLPCYFPVPPTGSPYGIALIPEKGEAG